MRWRSLALREPCLLDAAGLRLVADTIDRSSMSSRAMLARCA